MADRPGRASTRSSSPARIPRDSLTIITDLRKAGWDAGVAAVARKWNEQGVRVRIVDVGADEVANVALESLVPLDRTILAAAETHWEAVIRNDSPRVLNRAKAILRVDDRPTEVTLPEIPPRQVVRVPLTVRFPAAGMHDLSLQLPEDELPGDNHRWAAVPVKDSLLIRLVDGEPSSEPFGSEVDYLAAPLSIGVGDAEAWRVEVVQEEDFLAPRLEPADVIVLANVAAPTVEQARRLAELVRGGMGLMIFTGGKLDTGLYNERLFRSAEPLLPVSLKAQVDEAIRGLVIEPVRPSPIEKLLELKALGAGAGAGPPDHGRGGAPGRLERGPRARPLERPGAVPGDGRAGRRRGPGAALDDHRRPRGQRLADRAELRDGGARGRPGRVAADLVDPHRHGRRAAPAGGPFEPSARERPPHPAGRRRAEGARGRSRIDDRASGDPSPASAIDLPDTRKAGLYRLAWDEGPLGTQQDLFAANPDPRESALERIAAPDLKTLLAPLKVEVAVAKGDGTDASSTTGREIWHELAWGLLGLLILEPILAAWVGRSR